MYSFCRVGRNISGRVVNTKRPPAPSRPKPGLPPKPSLPQCRTLYAYDAQDTEELSFNAGETLEVLKEGWFGVSFMFASSYSFALRSTKQKDKLSYLMFELFQQQIYVLQQTRSNVG